MAGAGDIRAGRAFVEAYLDDSKLQHGLAQAQRRMQAWGASLTSMGTRVFAAGTAMLAPLLGSVASFAKAGDQLDKMAARTGASVGFLSALGHAAQIGGTNIETMETSVRKLQRTAYDATQGTKTAADAFSQLGVSATNADGSLKGTEQLFMETVTALSQVKNETQKAALATVLFGRAGTQLLPMLKDGKAGLAAVIDEAHKLGYTWTEEDTKAAAELTDAFTRLMTSVKMLVIRVGAELAPQMKTLADQLRGSVSAVIEWVKANGAFIIGLAKTAVQVAAVGAALYAFGTAAKVIAGVIAVVKGLHAALLVLAANPIALTLVAVTAAVVLLGAAFSNTAREAEALQNSMGGALKAGDQRRTETLRQIEALEALAKKERLNNEEMDRAQALINALQERYGQLGITVDRTTGRIGNLAAGIANLNEQMRQQAIRDTVKALKEGIGNLEALSAQASEIASTGVGHTLTGSTQLLQLESEIRRQKAENATLAGRLKGLKAGAPGAEALTGEKPGEAGAAGGLAAGEDEAKREVEARHRINQLVIEGVEDRFDRERMLLEERYRHEIELARKAGEDTKAIEIARDLDLKNLKDRRQREEAEGTKRFLEASAEERKRQLDQEQQLRDEIARAEIEQAEKDPKLKARKLLALEENRALEDARNEGIDPDLVKRLYELRRQALEAPGATADRLQSSIAGTFSAIAAARFGGGGSAADRTARATESMDKKMDRLLGKLSPDQVEALIFG